MPIVDYVEISGEEGTKVANNIEVLAFNDAVGLGAIGNCEVGGDVKEVAEGSHDVTREVGGVVATKVESSAITTKDSKKSFGCRLSRVVDGRDQFHVRSETANDDEYVDREETDRGCRWQLRRRVRRSRWL